MIPIYKRKGDILECGNHRGMKLLEPGMKMYERILGRRLREVIKIDERQCGFMPGKEITDAIFVLRQRKKILEGNQELLTAGI